MEDDGKGNERFRTLERLQRSVIVILNLSVERGTCKKAFEC